MPKEKLDVLKLNIVVESHVQMLSQSHEMRYMLHKNPMRMQYVSLCLRIKTHSNSYVDLQNEKHKYRYNYASKSQVWFSKSCLWSDQSSSRSCWICSGCIFLSLFLFYFPQNNNTHTTHTHQQKKHKKLEKKQKHDTFHILHHRPQQMQ